MDRSVRRVLRFEIRTVQPPTVYIMYGASKEAVREAFLRAVPKVVIGSIREAGYAEGQFVVTEDNNGSR